MTQHDDSMHVDGHTRRDVLSALALVTMVGEGCAKPTAPQEAPVDAAPPSAADAATFITEAEAEIERIVIDVSRASWIRETNITVDTDAVSIKAGAIATEVSTRYARGATRFAEVAGLDPDVQRKLTLLRTSYLTPAPDRVGAADELTRRATAMDTLYSTGTFEHRGAPMDLELATKTLRSSRDPNELQAVWEGWRTVSPKMRDDFVRVATLMNEGAQDLGFSDAGVLWRSGYDMPADEFASETERIWAAVEPLYRNLHAYVRSRLHQHYGAAVQPETGPIRAHLLGNMWGQDWSYIYPLVAPAKSVGSFDLDKLLHAHGYNWKRMVETGEAYYVSLGLPPLPATFWERSMFEDPKNRDVVCHASAWDIDTQDDLRLKMCIEVTGDDFRTIHHELGHNYYQRAYRAQPMLYREGASDAFHEAIGDFAELSATTPVYLAQIGLLSTVPGAASDVPVLLQLALNKVAFLPFGLMVDRWRWEVFSGQIGPDRYTSRWWELAHQYQGIAPPGPRPADAFDPGAKYHVAASVPYMRYFLAHALQFQFHRAGRRIANLSTPLHRTSLYGQKEMGAKFDVMMRMGRSRPWRDALEAFTGEREFDPSALLEYFHPLDVWLSEQNVERAVGW